MMVYAYWSSTVQSTSDGDQTAALLFDDSPLRWFLVTTAWILLSLVLRKTGQFWISWPSTQLPPTMPKCSTCKECEGESGGGHLTSFVVYTYIIHFSWSTSWFPDVIDQLTGGFLVHSPSHTNCLNFFVKLIKLLSLPYVAFVAKQCSRWCKIPDING